MSYFDYRPYSLLQANVQARLDLQDAVDALPCTPLQEELMALSVKKPGSYIKRYTYRLNARTDPQRFVEAWESTVRMCDALRTRIDAVDGKAFQVVTHSVGPWEETQNKSLDEVMAASQGVEMTYGSRLSRHALVVQDRDAVFFVWVVHLAICDFASLNLVEEAVHKAYWQQQQQQQQHQQHSHRIPPFSRYIRYLDTLDADKSIHYWRRQLLDARPLLFPPTKDIDPEAEMRVHAFDMRFTIRPGSNVTEANVVRAAWAVLLGRRNQSKNVLFGAAVSGRGAPVYELPQMVGSTMATVPVRLALYDSMSIENYLKGVQHQADTMAEHQHLGLHNMARFDAEAAEACDFATLVVVVTEPGEYASDLDQAGLAVMAMGPEERARMDRDMARFFHHPLVLVARSDRGQMHLKMYYNTSVLAEGQVQVLAHQLTHVTHQLVTSAPATDLESVTLVSDWDTSLLLRTADLPAAPQWCVHWLIDERARAQPTHPAIMSPDGDLSYGELVHLASKLAALLRRMGVGTQSVVALCFPKSTWAIVSMVAVLMAGGAFVSIETNGLARKLSTMVNDTTCNCSLLVTVIDHVHIAKALSLTSVTPTRAFLDALPEPTVGSLASSVGPSNTSFVVYTSGMTATSKGVPHAHSSLVAAIRSFHQARPRGPRDRILQYLPFTFDMGILDVMLNLCYGACICIPNECELFFDIAGAVNRTGANLLSIVPTAALDLDPASVPGLETLLLSGEDIPEQLTTRWAGHAEVHGVYGTAETSVCAWRDDLHLRPGTVRNIGHPLNSLFWVVEPGGSGVGSLVHVGGVGELVVHNASLGLGYCNRGPAASRSWLADVTWLRSREDPDRPVPAFRTSDLVRRNEDGTYEFMGRLDSQVSYRGRQVDLGALERVLQRSLPDDMDCAVSIIMDRMDYRYDMTAILWYKLTTPRGQGPKFQPVLQLTPALRAMLCRLHMVCDAALEPFLVPTMYIVYEGSPPMTMSGKVDRRALRERALYAHGRVANVFSTDNIVSGLTARPATKHERQLRELWASVLRADAATIHRHSNFFQVGGDSFSAIEVSKRARVLGWKLSVPTMFRSPHLETMAAAIVCVTL